MPSLVISEVEFQMLPGDVQQTLLAMFQPGADGVRPTTADDGEGPPDLSPAQARNVIAGCSPKTIEIIRQIADFPPSGFKMDELAAKVGVEPGSMRGSWAGLTKVSRRILGDPSAALIWWTELNETWHGRVSAMTHRSLRKALEV